MDQRVKRLMEVYVNDINNFFGFDGEVPVVEAIEKISACRSTSQEAMLVIRDQFVGVQVYDRSWSWMMLSITLHEVQVNDIGR